MLRRNPTKIELRQEDKEEVSDLQVESLQGLVLSCGTQHLARECSCSLRPSSSTRLSRKPLAPGRGQGPAGYLSAAPFSSSRRQALLCFTHESPHFSRTVLCSWHGIARLSQEFEAPLLDLHHVSVLLPAGSAERGCEDRSAEVMEVGLPAKTHHPQPHQLSLAARLQQPCTGMPQSLQQWAEQPGLALRILSWAQLCWSDRPNCQTPSAVALLACR